LRWLDSKGHQPAYPSRQPVDGPFLGQAARPDQFRAALARAISKGWLLRHESGTYLKFAPAGTEIFA
jgi:hypothetical protein